MLKAFWTWDPVSSGTYRAFDEVHAYHNNKWFFDKSVWQKMFRTMRGCGFNAMVLANTHPFPFMMEMPEYPEAQVINSSALYEYQSMHHWIFETAFEWQIMPYLMFFSIYFPEPLLKARGISPEAGLPSDFAVEYTHYCTRRLLENYPELVGIFAEASEQITGKRAEFLQRAVVDAVDAARPDAQLYIRGWCGDPSQYLEGIKRRGNRPIKYSVKYTYEHLVDSNPDPVFNQWVESAGAENINAEFWISNFEPWTSFSFDTAQDIVDNLDQTGCDGFSMHPLSLYDWPRSTDTYFKYQWQRDLVWYSVWGGERVSDLVRTGMPKWLKRNQRLLPGFEAGSRIMEILALYFAGDKQNQWHPQFCSIRDYDRSVPHLFSIEDMLCIDQQSVFWGRNWWEELTGEKVVHLSDYLKSGTPEEAYGPEELIDELNDLSYQAVEAGEKGMRSASGEKELPSFTRDAFCMGKLGEFYIERVKAALAHGRGEDSEALEHMNRALEIFRNISEVDSSHRAQFRPITGRCAIIGDWNATVTALEAELEDATKGEFKRGREYPIGEVEGAA